MELVDSFISWLAGDGRWIGGFDALHHEVEPISARLVLCGGAFLTVLALGWDTMYWESKSVSKKSAKAMRHLRRCCFAVAISGFLFPIVHLWWPAWRLWYLFVITVMYEGVAYLRYRLAGVVVFSQDREQVESVKQAVQEIKHMAAVVTEISTKLVDEQQAKAQIEDSKINIPWHYLPNKPP